MAFMEMQVPYHNRFLYLVMLALLLGCQQQVDKKAWINTRQHKLQQKSGTSYMRGNVFTGYEYQLFDNGDTALIVAYVEGRKDGVAKEWYADRQMKSIRNYRSGKYDGVQKGWYDNGQIKYQYHYKNDVYEGNVKEWLSDGQLYRDFNYVNGQEQGMQHMYWDNGKIRANYEARNGRKYGFTGVKNCTSIWVDITVDM